MEITRGKIPTAKKTVIYGPEGIGKSTLAACFPNAVFIDTEGSTKELTVGRLPAPTRWVDIINEVKWAAAHPEELDTLIVDTIDWAESMAVHKVCEDKGLKDIESAGYGKGYTFLAEEIKRLLRHLDAVIKSGTNVVIVAHAQMRKFEQPDEAGAYDRWELKLQKKVAPLVKEWADMVLFCNYKVNVVTDSTTKSKKAKGGKRVMYTTHNPCWDAKNRFDLPDELPMEFKAISHIFKDVPEKSPVRPSEPVPENPVKKWADTQTQAVLDESEDAPQATSTYTVPQAVADLLTKDNLPEDALRRALVKKGYLAHTDDEFDQGIVEWLTQPETWKVVAETVKAAIEKDEDIPF